MPALTEAPAPSQKMNSEDALLEEVFDASSKAWAISSGPAILTLLVFIGQFIRVRS
jgi:hypothetical protein